MRLYQRTDAADAIRQDGFRDGEGSYLTLSTYRGVWFSDSPLDDNEGVTGSGVVVVESRDTDLSEWEWVEEGKPHPEWLVPAEIANDWNI